MHYDLGIKIFMGNLRRRIEGYSKPQNSGIMKNQGS